MSRALRLWPSAELEPVAAKATPAEVRDAADAPLFGIAAPSEPLFAPPIPAAAFNTPLARLRRMTPAVLLNRLKRPFSRWHHARRDAAVVARFPRIDIAGLPDSGDICVIGAFRNRNGLSRAARYEIDRIRLRYPRAAFIDVSKADRTALRDFSALRRDTPPAIAVFLIQPNLIAAALRDLDPAVFRAAYRIGLAVWELPYFPPAWRTIDGFFHEYWTPSTFSAGALRAGTDRPVTVVPHAVRLPVPIAASRNAPRSRFDGLAVMDLSTCPDRKNPWAHVEAWQKAFGDDPTCVLTLKLRFSRRSAGVRAELQRMIGDAPNIRIVEQEMSDTEVLQLQVASDVCLSLHRSEGYGLTIREMLELGKAAVATDWSGNADFMGRYANAFPVRYALVPYRDYLARYPEFSGTWAEADTDHAARCLRVVAIRFRRALRDRRGSRR